MAGLFIPDARWLRGGLLDGTNPSPRNLVIDMSHPLGRACCFAFVPLPPDRGVDLVRGGIAEMEGNGTVDGRHFDFGTTGIINYPHEKCDINPRLWRTNTSPRSIVFAGLSYTVATNEVVFEKGSNACFTVQTVGSQPGKLSFRIGSSSNHLFSSTTYNDGIERNIAMTYEARTTQEFKAMYIDGRLDASSTTSGSAAAVNTSDVQIGARLGGTFPFEGTMQAVFCFNVHLTYHQGISITRNPWQMLRPAA